MRLPWLVPFAASLLLIVGCTDATTAPPASGLPGDIGGGGSTDAQADAAADASTASDAGDASDFPDTSGDVLTE